MTKADLVDSIANDANINKKQAGLALDSILGGITTALQSNEGRICLTGFGTFAVGHRKERMGRNPSTGEEIKIKASKVVKFKVGKELKEAIEK